MGKKTFFPEHRKSTEILSDNCILPGGKILSLSRMRADARSLMIYWRRTYLNTERKGAPSSVFKKGSFSHRSKYRNQTGSPSNICIPQTKHSEIQMQSYCTCSTFAKPGISVSQKLLYGAVPRWVDLQEHPLHREKKNAKKACWNRSDITVSVCGSYEVHNSSKYLFQSSVYIHLHLHDKQVWGLDKLLHHFCPVNAIKQIWV